MKFLYLSAIAFALCGFQRIAVAEEIKTELLDDRAVSEEAANPDALQDPEALDLQGYLDSQNIGDETALRARPPRNLGHPGRPGRPGWSHPGRGHDRDYRGPRFPGRIFFRTCFAKNARGQIFRASGTIFSSVNLQRRAVVTCRVNSRLPSTCRAIGCR